MADVDAEQLNTLVASTAKLLQTIDTMKFGVIFILFTLIVLVLGFVLVGRWMYMRNQDHLERKKEARAADLAGALNRLSSCMEQHTADDQQAALRLTIALDNVVEVTAKMDHSITVLSQRASGQMSKAASLRQIKRQFMKEVSQSVCLVFQRSLTENRYEERRVFISQKVKTVIGSILVEARQDMRGSPLAFTPDIFFVTYADHDGGGERFELCDDLWKYVEPLYMRQAPLKERIEEAFLTVQNTINDYLDRVIGDLDSPSPITGSDEPFRSGSSVLTAVKPEKKPEKMKSSFSINPNPH